MQKFGAIDIGTNSIRMIIAKVKDGKIVESYKDLQTTRIGENTDKTGMLSTAAMERTLRALIDFITLARREGLSHVPVIATSAVRDAKNREVFVKKAEETIGIHIDIIDGNREAELGFLGVQRGLYEDSGNILVVDIGGGSTEFILGNQKNIQYLVSLNAGAVRMTEKFITTDPVTKTELEHMKKEVDRTIEKTIHRILQYQIDRVIGIGGTATTIAAVSQSLEIYDREKIHHYDLRYGEIEKILHKFTTTNIEQRKNIPGLHPERADVIIAGTVILYRILTLLNKHTIRISEYDNLEGLVFEQIERRI